MTDEEHAQQMKAALQQLSDEMNKNHEQSRSDWLRWRHESGVMAREVAEDRDKWKLRAERAEARLLQLVLEGKAP